MKLYTAMCRMGYLVLLLIVSCLTSFSQGTSAGVNGSVTDLNGAVIPVTRITVQNTHTGLIQSVVSDAAGFYLLAPLPPGDYKITFEKSGYEKHVESVTLTVSQSAYINVQLQVGSQTETVVVNAGEILLNATTADVSNVVNQSTIEEMPLNGRDPSSLILLSPGVINILNTSAGYNQTSQSFATEGGASAGGGQQGSTFALLDGVPNMDSYEGLTAPFPNADATQEFRAITNNFGVQYGFSPGAVITLETRSGTNQIHGGSLNFLEMAT